MNTKKRGPKPVDKPQKSRTLRMDDENWLFFRKHLGAKWFRVKVALERKRYNAQQSTQAAGVVKDEA